MRMMDVKEKINKVIQISAIHFDVDPAEIKSKSHQREIADMKMMVTYFIKTNMKITLQELANLLNLENHSSIYHRVNTMASLMVNNKELKSKYDLYYRYMLIAAEWAIDPLIVQMKQEMKKRMIMILGFNKGSIINESLIEKIENAIY